MGDRYKPFGRLPAWSGRVSLLFCLLLFRITVLPASEEFAVEGLTSNAFSVGLLLESPYHNPPYYVLSFGVHPDGTDGYDNGLDQQLPPLPPSGRDFEAYFPCDQGEKDQLQLVRDIRGEVEGRHVWMFVAHGGEGTMSWYPHTFPRSGTFLLNDLIDMRVVTTMTFSLMDTMTVIYNKPGTVPDIHIDQISTEFGHVLIGTSQTRTFPLTNLGEGDLLVSGTTLTVPEFALLEPVLPVHIDPLQSIDMTISFSPTLLLTETDTLVISSNDPDEPTISITLGGMGASPEMEITSTDHDFGDVPVGEIGEWDMNVSNHGNWNLIVDTLAADDPAFTVRPESFTVGPLDSQSVTVRFEPSRPGPVTGLLTLHSDDPDEPAATVSLAGTGIAPDILLSAPSHSFGTITVGDTGIWDLFVANTGEADLVVDTIEASPEVFGTDPVIPLLSPGDGCTVRVFFAPLSTGPVDGQLRIVTNDPEEPRLCVDLSGEGIEEDKPDLYLEETGHDFGRVEIGSSDLWNFDLINLGTEYLIIEDLQFTHSAFTADPTAFSVGPGALQEVRVTFAPTEIESISAHLTILSNDPDEPMVSISVLGVGVPTTGVEESLDPSSPQDFYLYQNSPNPFNSSTVIRYQIPGNGCPVHTVVEIYNMLGRRVRTVVDEVQEPGPHVIGWDGRDEDGRGVSSGIYSYRLKANGFTDSRMMLLLR